MFVRKPKIIFYLFAFTIVGIGLILINTGHNEPHKHENVQLEVRTYENKTKCLNKSPIVLYLIKSKISEFELREAVRKTWAKQDQYGLVKRVFIIGQPNPLEDFGADQLNKLSIEKNTYEDIIQGDFIDAYRNLTLKIKFTLKWAHDNYLKSRFFLIADDDTFVNPPFFFKYLEKMKNLGENQHLYAGWKWEVSAVDRNQSSSHYLSYDDYPENNYPAFINGAFILLSNYTLKTLYEQSKIKFNIHKDDAYLGVLASRAKIPLTDIEKVLPGSINDLNRNVLFMSTHHFIAEELFNLWQRFNHLLEIDFKYYYHVFINNTLEM